MARKPRKANKAKAARRGANQFVNNSMPAPAELAKMDTADAKNTNQLIAILIRDQLAKAADIYKYKLGNPKYEYVPHCIYFFYMRLNSDGSLFVDHYFYTKGAPDDPSTWLEIPYEEVEGIMYDLAVGARPSGSGFGKMEPNSFQGIKFRRKSYIGFFLDEANWSFHKRQDRKTAMVFNATKAGVKDNYSFFDAKDVQFQMPKQGGGFDIRTGIFFVNHMKKNAKGDDLSDKDPVKFAFDMYFDVKFSYRTKKKIVVIFDPGGENQGPPQQP